MSVFQSEAITLRTYPYSDFHKIAVFLTRSFGKVRGVAHGAKKGAKNRFGSSLEPLTLLRLTFSRKQNQELATIQECEIIRPLPAYRLSFEVNLHIGYFAELLQEVANEEEESETLFRLAAAVLGEFERAPIELLARYFELWLLKLEGVLPALEERLPRQLAERTQDMLRRHPSQLEADCLAPDELNRLRRLAERLLEAHLEKRLKTSRLLRELLG